MNATKSQNRRGRLWGLGVLAFFALVIGAYALIFYVTPEAAERQPFVTGKGAMPGIWIYVLWVHAISAGIAIAVGWLQFARKLRQRKPGLHRAVGSVYAVGITLAGVTGLYLAWYANGGWSGRIGFAALSVLWLYTLYRSLRSILAEHKPREHGEWMLRNYALTCAAITLRIYVPIAAALLGIPDTNDSFVVIAWLAWVPNLFVAQWWIGRRRRQALARTSAPRRTSHNRVS